MNRLALRFDYKDTYPIPEFDTGGCGLRFVAATGLYSNFRFTPTYFFNKGHHLYGDLRLGAVTSKLKAETLLNTSNDTRYDFHAYGRLGVACAFVNKNGRGCALSFYAESFMPVFAERNLEYKIAPFGLGMGIAWLF